MILPLEGQLRYLALSLLVEVNTADAGCVVPVQLAVFLDFTEHRSIDPSPVQVLKVCPVFVVLTSTRDRRPVRQLGRPNIANVSAVALALPVVLLPLLIGESEHRQTTEPLPGQILVPYLQTATGLGVPRVELVEVRLYFLPTVTSTADDGRGMVFPSGVRQDDKIAFRFRFPWLISESILSEAYTQAKKACFHKRFQNPAVLPYNDFCKEQILRLFG